MSLQEERLKRLESMEDFLRGTAGLSARMVRTEAERQAHVRAVLGRFSYLKLKRIGSTLSFRPAVLGRFSYLKLKKARKAALS
ncbi:MAG: hypothetical protein LBT81_01015 [Helicobacteraceae bacterium]|nr:hypothetical protein [Helicobacteraceae bacterium]